MNTRLYVLSVSLSVSACASLQEKPAEPKKTHYTLKAGQTVEGVAPMPSKTPIFVQWHFDDGHMEAYHGFTGWDFDQDQRYEMVQVLDDKGNPKAVVYDFDGDGKIDQTDDVSIVSQEKRKGAALLGLSSIAGNSFKLAAQNDVEVVVPLSNSEVQP